MLLPALLLVALWGLQPLSHDDLFWHMHTGEIVLRDGTVPTSDSFSYTRFGEPFVSHEWGFGVLTFVISEAGGFPALVGFQVVLALAIFAALVLVLRQTRPRPRDASVFIPLVAVLALWAGAHELELNAALLTTLFLLWELLLLYSYRRTGRWSRLAALAVLVVVWSNVHSGVLFGLMLLGFWWIESWAEPLLAGRGSGFRRSAGCAPPRVRFALLCSGMILSVLNPNGVAAPLYPVRLSLFLFTSDLPLHMGHFTAPTPADRPAFFLFVAILLAGLLPFRRIRRLTISEILTIVVFLGLSLRSSRFILDFAVLASPVVWKLHARILSSRPGPWPLPAGAAVALALSIGGTARSFDFRLLAEEVPQRAAAFLEEEGIRGRILNHQNYGGYLGWRLRMPVFWDGRNEVFGPLMTELVGKSLAEIVARYDVDILLLTELQYTPLHRQISRAEWGLAYWDDYCAVFLRRIPRFQEILSRNEYRFFPAFGSPPDLENLPTDSRRLRDARAELGRVLARNPDSQRAWFYQGVISFYAGDLRRARSELERAASVRPNEVVDQTLSEVLGYLSPGAPRARPGEPIS